MRPGSPEAQERFKQLVQGAVQKRFARFLSPDSFMISLEKNAKVVLAWQTEPRDLDLHLHLTLPNKVYDINFSDIGSLSNPPWAQLEKDIRDSAEPEVIRVSQWEKGKYQFAVHNYSKERILTGCGAKLTFVYGEEEITYQCPQEGTGEWWLAFEIDGRTGEVNVVNKIAEVPW
jgi:adhesin/invasin